MIRFPLSPEPEGFAKKVTRPGTAWLAKHSEGRPKDLWSPFKPQLAEAFSNLCAYTAMYEPVGTVDHFVSCSEDRSRAYDWTNYRYASQWINASKGNIKAALLLDPFQVEEGWFEVILPSLQLVVSEKTPENLRERAEFVLQRLHLRDDERVIRQRREWYRMYQEGELSLEGLRKKAPLLAVAIDRQQGAPKQRSSSARRD